MSIEKTFTCIEMKGDGRCLFRSVIYGAYLRHYNFSPPEPLQTKLADNLRAKVANELIKRREEMQWIIEGDYDAYVSKIKETHAWGGEVELLMASHILEMPITVYIDEGDDLKSIAEYGQEYEYDPITVLYHKYGHYDALQIHNDNADEGCTKKRKNSTEDSCNDENLKTHSKKQKCPQTRI